MSREDANEAARPPSSVPVDEARREALRRIGKYGAYTAPVLLAMLESTKAAPVTDA
jgi:hypothetical protein